MPTYTAADLEELLKTFATFNEVNEVAEQPTHMFDEHARRLKVAKQLAAHERFKQKALAEANLLNVKKSKQDAEYVKKVKKGVRKLLRVAVDHALEGSSEVEIVPGFVQRVVVMLSILESATIEVIKGHKAMFKMFPIPDRFQGPVVTDLFAPIQALGRD